ncbi:glycosyltransferase family 4 protein [Pinibacter soli]|uniref:Glycosyltransferase family 4 protein n=1 Tax=Pinibacter soli TaxID=3044211 RepID=A0ABT6RDB8_9BACT|nr:glycosyltransferase family 4 protein [Pinibacter soli]MDI3320561.1 glycosyltransferase family 4 protein [Pinibacter soli]
MFTLIDLTFFANKEFTSGSALIESQAASLGYLRHIKERVSIEIVKHMSKKEHRVIKNGLQYHFFKSNNHFFSFPLKTLWHIRKRQPDIVLTQGLSFPFQVLMLRLFAVHKTRIIAQHHGERCGRSMIKRIIEQWADKCIDAYLFNTPSYADERLQLGLISSQNKIMLLPEGSNTFRKKNKQEARLQAGIASEGTVFLWVGRLNDNKDPLTILHAFAKYLSHNADAQLYMIYQTEDLRPAIIDLLNQNDLLRGHVRLLGKINRNHLEMWYNAADYFITGSHRDYGAFALLEAMACGCVPIVTNISTMQQYLQHGETGFLFPPGDVEVLSLLLTILDQYNIEEMSQKVADHFRTTYSFEKIASSFYDICTSLLAAKQSHYAGDRVIDMVSSNA